MFCQMCWRLPQSHTNTVFNPVPPRHSDVSVDKDVPCLSYLKLSVPVWVVPMRRPSLETSSFCLFFTEGSNITTQHSIFKLSNVLLTFFCIYNMQDLWTEDLCFISISSFKKTDNINEIKIEIYGQENDIKCRIKLYYGTFLFYDNKNKLKYIHTYTWTLFQCRI